MLRQAREHAVVSQSELARRSGVARYLVNRYERGLSEPSVAQLDRILDVVDRELTVQRELTRGERRSLRLAERVAAKLRSEPERTLRIAREQLARQHAAATDRERAWLAVWDAVLELPVEILADLLVDTGEFARAMRTSSPMTVALDDDTRREALDAAH